MSLRKLKTSTAFRALFFYSRCDSHTYTRLRPICKLLMHTDTNSLKVSFPLSYTFIFYEYEFFDIRLHEDAFILPQRNPTIIETLLLFTAKLLLRIIRKSKIDFMITISRFVTIARANVYYKMHGNILRNRDILTEAS